MSITYEANLNCDGQNCKTRPVTSFRGDAESATRIVKHEAKQHDWVIIDGEHYCPDCAEIFKAKETC